jgi:hypothetical protein
MLEVSRLAAEIGSDLYSMSPFILRRDDSIRIEFCIDTRDDNADFFTKLGEHIKNLEKSSVHWAAIELLRSSQQRLPDLRQEGVTFDPRALSDEGRAGFSKIRSEFDSSWSEVRIQDIQ